MTPPKKQKNDLIFHAGVDPKWQVARTEALKGDVQGDGLKGLPWPVRCSLDLSQKITAQ